MTKHCGDKLEVEINSGISHNKDITFLNIDLNIQHSFNKIPWKLFFVLEHDKLVLNFVWKYKKPNISKKILKNRGGALILSDTETYYKIIISSVQFSSVTQSCPTLCDPMDWNTPGLPVYHQLPEFTQAHVHWVGDAIQPSHHLWFPSPPAFNLSQGQGLFNGSVLHIRWPKYWSFSFNISPSNEYSELISFRMDWLGLLAVQGMFKSLLQHHSSKAPILRHSAFFIVQLSHPYMTTGKNHSLD